METPAKPSLARNLTSGIGILISLIALANIVFLVLADLWTEHGNPYVGILGYIVVPAFLLFGIALFLLGIVLEHRRRRRHSPDETSPYPRFDFNQARTRRIFLIAVLSIFVFVVVSLLGSYQAYHYTDSDQFCGATCHTVMEPEYTAYQRSPHARVGCVECHIGPGATWFVRSKLSGAYQVYSTLAKKYSRPIASPVPHLRPAQETCEQCHWPAKFWGAQMKVFNHFGYDEANTPRETRMLIKIGGGDPAFAKVSGIHWHMNIANEITYIATDPQRQDIPWVRLRNRATGQEVVYASSESKLTPSQITSAPKRVMDCVDCHNRPTHIFLPPDEAVDNQMLIGAIDASIPYVKREAVNALTKPYKTTSEAVGAIKSHLDAFYRTTYPADYSQKKQAIDRAIVSVQTIYQGNIFPEMKVDWKTHPDNIGHLYFPGCFRCHDNQHTTADGKTLSNACEVCHTVLSQREGSAMMVAMPDQGFTHPVDLGDLTLFRCSDCHSGAAIE